MRHEHLVVTVEADTKERIDDDLDAGESLEAWIADAVERKLDGEDRREADATDRGAGSGDEDIDRIPSRRAREDEAEDGWFDGDAGSRRGGDADGGRFGRDGDGSNDDRADDGDDKGFEYVDDCAI